MKKIKLLNSDKQVFVDDIDYKWLLHFPWRLHKSKGKDYATYSKRINGKYKRIWMHRVIMDVNKRDLEVFHKDSNPLNNQKNNLQVVTHQDVIVNRAKSKNKTSNYKGVSYCSTHKKYRARICINGKTKYLGYFHKELDAANAYKAEYDKIKLK